VNHNAGTLNLGTHNIGRGGKRALARHFAEMLLAIFAGMVVLRGLAELAFAASRSGLSDQSGGFRIALMGLNMTVPMVLWMSYRGHARAQNLEMAASMIVPSLAAAILAWAACSGRRPVSRSSTPR
jgi:hypothetical protein